MKLTPEEIEEIKSCARRGISIRKTAKAMTLPPSTVTLHWCRGKKDKVENAVETVPDQLDSLLTLLRRQPLTIEEIAAKGKSSKESAIAWVALQQSRGVNLHCFGDHYSIAKEIPPLVSDSKIPEFVSDSDNTFLLGASGDQHLCSKHERLDVLNDIYDKFEQAGITRVLNTGNYIDGEARFNKFEIHTYGLGRQLEYLAKHFPRRNGMSTYAVSGDDHEGWYGQREGVDIGKYAENAMREEGRDDWHNLGFIEAHIRLVNANTGKSSILTVMHPGGGSAYAISYQPQKLVESLEGGEKPAVLMLGHYHKLSANNIRNVWVVQTGCTQDQTTFMKKKRIDAHVGGLITKLYQDPETGAIVRFMPDMLRYFNRGYYGNKRWSYSGDVDLPRRI